MSVTLQFESEARMLEFARWVRQYHLVVTQPSDEKSGLPGDYPRMVFSSSKIPGQDGMMGVWYTVTMPTIPVKLSYDNVAPTMSLTLNILTSGDQNEVAASSASGSFKDYMKSVNVAPRDVSNAGDGAFLDDQNRGQG